MKRLDIIQVINKNLSDTTKENHIPQFYVLSQETAISCQTQFQIDDNSPNSRLLLKKKKGISTFDICRNIINYRTELYSRLNRTSEHIQFAT